MGQKVHPGIRLSMGSGVSGAFRAAWYAEPRDYAKKVQSDLLVRAYLEKALKSAGLSSIVIAFTTQESSKLSEYLEQNLAKITVYVARPGVVIGKKGAPIEKVKHELEKMLGMSVYISIQEVRRAELDAKLVAENIASQLVRRINHRRAMKRAIDTAMKMGAVGIKVAISGRLGGTEIARSESAHKGRMPLHEFRAHIDYENVTAHTIAGAVGVSVWIHTNPKQQLAVSGGFGGHGERRPQTARNRTSRSRSYSKKT